MANARCGFVRDKRALTDHVRRGKPANRPSVAWIAMDSIIAHIVCTQIICTEITRFRAGLISCGAFPQTL
jgi:hypothetical protein